MTALCPLVLSQLGGGPRHAHEVARALGGDQSAARATLARLEAAGLVWRRALATGVDFQLTARGRRELRLQRALWTRVVLTRHGHCQAG
jgi:DNA-binding MarR family transcriptional regulator